MRPRPVGCLLTTLSLLALAALCGLGLMLGFAAGFNDNGNPEAIATIERVFLTVRALGIVALVLALTGVCLAYAPLRTKRPEPPEKPR